MSSARKRSAIQKANNEAEFLRQRLMRAEHYASVMQSFAEVAARRSDALHSALVAVRQYPGVVEYVGTQITDAVDTALAMGSNV